MRYANSILIAVIVLCGFGCTPRQHFSRFRFDDKSLLPKTTPYDTNDVLRLSYQFAYTWGYQDFLRAYGDRRVWIYDDTSRDGYLAGIAAAFKARDEYWNTNAADLK